MGAAHRIAGLYAAKVNAALDRACDPGELADYSYIQLQDLLAEVHRGAGHSRPRTCRTEGEELRHAADRLSGQAGRAVQAGQEDLARQALTRRVVILAEVSAMGEQHAALLAEEQKLQAAELRLQAKVEEFGARKEAIKAACTAAQSRASIADALAGISGEVADADQAARRAEEQAAGLKARQAALGGLPAPAATALSDERLTGQLDEISRRAEVEDELARIRQRLAPRAGRGHRTVPRTAGLRIEAWAPTREECLAEAVRGLVDSFAVVRGLPPQGRAKRHMTAWLDEDLLVAVIDEVIYRLDADGQVPVSVAVRRAPDGGVTVFLALAPVAEAEITGAVPKAASLHDLRCGPDAAGRWSCAVTVNV